MSRLLQEKDAVIIKFAGDSGDGMQLTGGLFTNDTAITGSDLATFPDFPAEIRAPAGTLAGVSGFQLHFGSRPIYTPGDRFDVLVAMNAAALKVNLSQLKRGGTIIANTDGFDSKNLRLARYEAGSDPLDDTTLDGFELIRIQVTKITREALADTDLSVKEKDRCKNMFVLGFLLWRYNRSLDTTRLFLERKFRDKPELLNANKKVLQAGYNYADTVEEFTSRFKVKPAPIQKGIYRSIMGSEALVLGLIAASRKSGLPLFYGSYPITPASNILQGLAAYKHFGIKTFQAEDEIAAMCSVIGAAYGGNLAITGSSGPGIALKAEAMGLGMMLELPMVIVNVQRGGPSTGLPTKTEQADLMQALYGRNGECPMPVIAAATPADTFEAIMEACRIAIRHMTPVIFLSDGYIANGAEPWRFPAAEDLPEIPVPRVVEGPGEEFRPYRRDENHVRSWAIPGQPGYAHRIGGLEKEAETGHVSYDPANHEYMVKIREAKVEKIADFIPPISINAGVEEGDVLVLGWGSTMGVCESVTREMAEAGYRVGHAHLRYLKPFPKGLPELLGRFKKVVVPEINNGQLSQVLQGRFLHPVISCNKIQGLPISREELEGFIKQVIDDLI